MLMRVAILFLVAIGFVTGCGRSELEELRKKYGSQPIKETTGRFWIASNGMKFVQVPAGYFLKFDRWMCSQEVREWLGSDRAVWISEKSVTNQQWEQISGSHPVERRFPSDDDPYVSGFASTTPAEQAAFCADLLKHEPGTFRLPTYYELCQARCAVEQLGSSSLSFEKYGQQFSPFWVVWVPPPQ